MSLQVVGALVGFGFGSHQLGCAHLFKLRQLHTRYNESVRTLVAFANERRQSPSEHFTPSRNTLERLAKLAPLHVEHGV